MSIPKLWKTKTSMMSRFLVIFLLITGWIFSGWPQIFNFPLGVQKAQAAITFEQMPSGASTSSPISINLSVVFPDDLIYNGSPCLTSPCPIGSVGLTREPLLNMKWWGIVVDNETDNFVSECVSTALPLPAANFNLGPGDYKTEISLAETKADCETFNQNSYPLFAIMEAANFTIK